MMRRDPGGGRCSGCSAGVARSGDRGAITAEAAFVVPSLVLVALVLAWVVSLIGLRLQAIDAAREAARAVARGESVSAAESAAHRIASPASQVRIAVAAEEVRVRVAVPVASQLPGGVLGRLVAGIGDLEIGAEAVAAREDLR